MEGKLKPDVLQNLKPVILYNTWYVKPDGPNCSTEKLVVLF